MTITISVESIAQHLEVLATIGNLGNGSEGGFLRAAYSDEETAAMKYIENIGVRSGFSSRWDPVGNLVIEMPGADPGFLEIGSHLDTVPLGGNFDGAAGIVAGLEALRTIAASGAPLRYGLRLRVWRAEESATFASVYTGSQAAFGILNPTMLANRFEGVTLEEAMQSQGCDPFYIHSRKPTISAEERDQIKAHLELHIEQGKVLEQAGESLGLVTSIRGNRRLRIVFSGEFDHSGATPLGIEYRRDVNLAMAHFIVALNHLGEAHVKKGLDLVQTVGLINSEHDYNDRHPEVYQNGLTKVSGYGYMTLDIRSSDNDVREEYCVKVDALLKEVASGFRVQSRIENLGASPALEEMTPAIRTIAKEICVSRKWRHREMASGAGHDVAVVARQKRTDGSAIPVGLVFVPCLNGKSHCPEEFAKVDDIARGASLLAEILTKIP